MTQSELTHINRQGDANMVDVSDKAITSRAALAEGFVCMSEQTLELIERGEHQKGDVFAVARIAGIQGAKQCSQLIPLCHPLALTKVSIDLSIDKERRRVRITCLCKLDGKTGVEMEALTGVSVACLTLFDMCKAVDPLMVIEGIKVIKKEGGKHGSWQRD